MKHENFSKMKILKVDRWALSLKGDLQENTTAHSHKWFLGPGLLKNFHVKIHVS